MKLLLSFRQTTLLTLVLVCCCGHTSFAQNTPNASDWAQWGGPQRNFISPATGLATNWPTDGPRKLWSRPLGDGYSSIAVAGGRLFTLYRKGEQEVVIALDAATGKTLWEYAYAAPFWKEQDMSNGPGPHATPLVTGNFVFTTGATGKLHCLDRQTGKLVWAHDLFREFNGTVRVNGYSCSPLAYQNTVIVQVGGAGNALMAFRQSDGAVVWKQHDFKNSTSSPLLINVGGQAQIVAFMYGEIVGVDPQTGALLWQHPHETDYGLNTMTPVWGADNLLFISSGYNGGSRVLKLTQSGGKTSVEEVWFHRLMRVHFGTCVRIGDLIIGSSGDFGPAPLTAVNVQTGKIVWRNRSFPRASFLLAEGHLLVFDEDGNLALATATPAGLTVQAKTQLLNNNAWTVPALAGTTLYVRDRRTLVAVDLKAVGE